MFSAILNRSPILRPRTAPRPFLNHPNWALRLPVLFTETDAGLPYPIPRATALMCPLMQPEHWTLLPHSKQGYITRCKGAMPSPPRPTSMNIAPGVEFPRGGSWTRASDVGHPPGIKGGTLGLESSGTPEPQNHTHPISSPCSSSSSPPPSSSSLRPLFKPTLPSPSTRL